MTVMPLMVFSVLSTLFFLGMVSSTLHGGRVDPDNYMSPETRTGEISRMEFGKRSTMLLNKLMHALHKALRTEGAIGQQMELHRRGEGKMFWRCYFNAVSCFRRK